MCDCNSCCGNYAENSYWRDKQIKECEDKIKELEIELVKSQESVAMWRGNYAENRHWRDIRMKECEDKIKELETKLTKSQTSLAIWREKALYHAPVFSSYKPAEPIESETTFGDVAFVFFCIVLPWLMVIAVFFFGWNGVLR